MKHPFQVGEKYRNREGEYEVIGLDGSKMVIRYSNGKVLETTVEMQTRIWENIQADASMSLPDQTFGPRPSRQRRGGQRGLAFQGLQDHDFKKGVAGTSWRARTSLGGLLAQRLSDTSPHFFQSYAIYRRAEVHIAQPMFYDTETKLRNAKFVFALNPECARYGFYIEKNDGPMDDTWHWPNFLIALEGDPKLQQEIESAMRQLGLCWEVYVWAEGGLLARMRASSTGLMLEQQDDEPEEASWSVFTKRLRNIDTEKWCDLHLCTFSVKDQVIAAGIQIVDTVTKAYQKLLPLYEASTGRTKFG